MNRKLKLPLRVSLTTHLHAQRTWRELSAYSVMRFQLATLTHTIPSKHYTTIPSIYSAYYRPTAGRSANPIYNHLSLHTLTSIPFRKFAKRATPPPPPPPPVSEVKPLVPLEPDQSLVYVHDFKKRRRLYLAASGILSIYWPVLWILTINADAIPAWAGPSGFAAAIIFAYMANIHLSRTVAQIAISSTRPDRLWLTCGSLWNGLKTESMTFQYLSTRHLKPDIQDKKQEWSVKVGNRMGYYIIEKNAGKIVDLVAMRKIMGPYVTFPQ